MINAVKSVHKMIGRGVPGVEWCGRHSTDRRGNLLRVSEESDMRASGGWWHQGSQGWMLWCGCEECGRNRQKAGQQGARPCVLTPSYMWSAQDPAGSDSVSPHRHWEVFCELGFDKLCEVQVTEAWFPTRLQALLSPGPVVVQISSTPFPISLTPFFGK